MLPAVAIIGRTNVGKSTLFNRITRSRRAIVADEPGVTRDRLFGKAEFREKPFILIDTGGYEDPHGEFLKTQMLEQTELGIQEADVLVFIVDGRAGLLPADEEVAAHLRQSGKPVHLAVNKLDEQRFDDMMMPEFYKLGFETVHPISAEHGAGIDELLEAVTVGFAEKPAERDDADIDWDAEETEAEKESMALRPLRVALVGRPNVGKSSLVNKLLGYERMVVHDMPGTTRDAIDSELNWNGKKVILVDTAGVRRKSRVTDRIEKFSALKAFRAIAECDVAVMVLDASIGVHEQDARIAGMIVDEGRAIVIVFNKWDVPEGREQKLKELTEQLKDEMKFLPDPEVVFVSAKSGQRTGKILELAEAAGRENSKRIPTSQFNDLVLAATERHKPPQWANHPVKFYYAAQIGVRPPTFALQTNWPQGVHFSYQRFIENMIREKYGFKGAPIRLKFRQKGKPRS
jgi:GTP-binding protein